MVEAGQCREALAGDVRRIAHRNQGVGVGRVSGHRDTHVISSVVVQGLALNREDRAVGLEQVAALHAGATRARTDEQGEVDPFEELVRVVADLDSGQRREGAVVELHHDALKCLEGRGDLEQPELHGSVPAEERTAGDMEEQAVADLACGAGHGDFDGCSAHWVVPLWLAPLRATSVNTWSTLAATPEVLVRCCDIRPIGCPTAGVWAEYKVS